MAEYNVVDLFCGTGGFAHGFSAHSKAFKIACAIDLVRDAAATTEANHPGCFVLNDDIRNIRPSHVRKLLKGKKIHLIIGGPPCQGFSSLRPFRSSNCDDPRNSLFEEFVLYVQYFRPLYFVLENVVGLLTHRKGETLKAILKCFADLKYHTEWRILNAANFGVPQKRERFILIGARGGYSIKFPNPSHSFNGKSMGYQDKSKVLEAAEHLPKPVSVAEAIGDLPPLRCGECADEYDSEPQNTYQKARRENTRKLTLHVAANHSLKMLAVMKHAGENIRSIPSHLITSGFSSCYSRLSADEPATTITVKFSSPASSKCIHPFQDRAITPREAARLQGFDDNYVFCGSKTEICSQIGNAVPPLLGKAIAESILETLS